MARMAERYDELALAIHELADDGATHEVSRCDDETLASTLRRLTEAGHITHENVCVRDLTSGDWLIFPHSTSALKAVVVELDTWEAALHRWGRHESDCEALDIGGRCSCGLTAFAWPKEQV